MGIYLILTLLGLLIGSFISAITYRIPRGLGFVKGRSFCDNCKTNLRWYDNIPLFSFLLLGGKSNCCGQKISVRYPLIEVTTAIGFISLYLYSFSFIYYLLFTISLVIFVIDLEYQIIPDELSWFILLLGLILNFSFVNIFAGFLFSLLLLILYLITAGRGMGLGDVKLAISLGVILGLKNGVTWIVTSFILGGIIASILLILKRAKLKTKIAFGPFLIFAFWLTLLIYG